MFCSPTDTRLFLIHDSLLKINVILAGDEYDENVHCKNKHLHCFSVVSLKKNLDEKCAVWLVVCSFKHQGFKTGGFISVL
jgi:hypothetical protein